VATIELAPPMGHQSLSLCGLPAVPVGICFGWAARARPIYVLEAQDTHLAEVTRWRAWHCTRKTQ